MKLQPLTQMVEQKFPGSGLWVEQEGEELPEKRLRDYTGIQG